MQAGSILNPDSVQWVSRVLVAGVQRDVDSWSIDREIDGGLPARLDASASGLTQATGNIQFSGSDVAVRPRTPFNPGFGWIPAKGDSVQILVGDGATEWTQFVGVIDAVSGEIGDGVKASIIDKFDKLSVEARLGPLLRAMPPLNGNGDPYRNIGLTPLYHLDHFLRQAGFHCTPPFESGSSLTVHGQTSTWPIVGSLKTTTTPNPTVNGHPTVNRAPWGTSISGFTTTYAPAGTYTTANPVQITMCVAPDHLDNARVQVYTTTSGKSISLNVNVNRRVIVYVNNVAIVGINLTPAETVASALFKNGTVTIEVNGGRTVSAAVSVTAEAIVSTTIHADPNARVCGFQVSHPTTAAQELVSPKAVPSAKLNTERLSLVSYIDAAPAFKGRSVAEVLGELCAAKLSSLWIDEKGVMQWADAETLEARAPVRTVTTVDDILSLGWRAALTQSASKVTVTSKRPAITVGRYKNRVLYQGGATSESMKSLDELEIIIEPEANETWIMSVLSFTTVGGAGGSWAAANNPESSLAGLYYTADGGTTEATGLTCTITTQVLDYEKISVKYVAGAWPSDVEGVLGTSPTAAALWPKNRDKGLPKLVGQGRVIWSDREYSIAETGGAGPELVHETGYWCNRSNDDTILQRYAEFLRDRVVAPLPIVEGLSLVPDPRLQLGDVITVESTSLIGAKFNALIKSVSTSFDGGGLSMDVNVRVISANTTAVTYETWQAALPGSSMTYADLNALAPTPQTYAGFNSQP